MKKKELSFEELAVFVKEEGYIDKKTAFKIFGFVADEDGFFKEGFDPYRSTNKLFYDLLFNEDGSPWDYVLEFLFDYIDSQECAWASDLVRLYHTMHMYGFTKGNYSTIYAWR